MATIDLAKYGITGVEEVVYNPSYETLFEEETKEGLTGFRRRCLHLRLKLRLLVLHIDV